jgi:ActR/RegA family two-component response regulator
MPAGSRGAQEPTLEQVQREHIVRILVESGGVVTSAATRLGPHLHLRQAGLDGH